MSLRELVSVHPLRPILFKDSLGRDQDEISIARAEARRGGSSDWGCHSFCLPSALAGASCCTHSSTPREQQQAEEVGGSGGGETAGTNQNLARVCGFASRHDLSNPSLRTMGLARLLLLSFIMLFATLLASFAPLLVTLTQRQVQVISTFGVGLLVGAALTVVIPEGVEAVYGHSGPGEEASGWVGGALMGGFLLM